MVIPPVPWAAHSKASPLFPRIIFFPVLNLNLVQLKAIPSCPISSYTGAEADSHLATTSLQAVAESHKVSLEGPLLQSEQSQFPQSLPLRLVLQTPHSSVALLWTHSRTSMSFLYWRAQNWTEYLRYSLTEGQSPLFSCWLCFFWYKSWCHWSSLPPGHTASAYSDGC